MNIIAQLFGFAAITDSIFIYQQTKRQNILRLKVLQDLFWMTHYIILSAWSAAATSGICMLRGVVFYNNDKGIFKSRIWLYVFILFYAVSAVMTWQDIFSLCPALSSSIYAVGFWLKDPRKPRCSPSAPPCPPCSIISCTAIPRQSTWD